jgi:hypothetical protein
VFNNNRHQCRCQLERGVEQRPNHNAELHDGRFAKNDVIAQTANDESDLAATQLQPKRRDMRCVRDDIALAAPSSWRVRRINGSANRLANDSLIASIEACVSTAARVAHCT